MASLRNAVKRREHRERSQPERRKRYGLLEKKQDYKNRAEDFHRKERTIKHLQSKAAERNPDEFYFAMQSSATKDGVHIASSSSGKRYSQKELALMRTQDAGYLHSKAQAEARKEERLQAALHCLGAPAPRRRHTVFVDDAAAVQGFSPVEHFDTDAAALGRAFNRPRRGAAGGGTGRELSAKVSRKVLSQYKELQACQERKETLQKAAHAVDMQRALAGKGSKRKIPATKHREATYVWQTVRKK